jgi:hypothetical protein
MKIATNSFVRRQIADSKFSHFSGSWEQLEALVEMHFEKAQQGYKDGVMLVPVPCEGFFSGVVEVAEGVELKATFSARRKGEAPYLDVVALGGAKLPAKAVEIVLYRHDVLAADNEQSTDAEWEIISLNARPTEGPEPMHPMAMARNQLGLAGGTKAEYTAEQFAGAIVYWSTRAMKG